MLTFSNPQTADQADHYFKKDMDYYLGDNPVLGNITGEASKQLSLNNTMLTPQSYPIHAMLCNGHFGEKQLIQKGASKKHSAGFDITMADPKELSILRTYCKANGNSFGILLDQAHENAIQKTFDFIQRYAGYRKLINGKSTFIYSGKLIASRFKHETNRFDEPHAHTHHFIYNMTVDNNGKWRALENFHLFKNQDLFHR
jgi:conjugative relaxase-like TrwC/TraI family protein